MKKQGSVQYACRDWNALTEVVVEEGQAAKPTECLDYS